MKTGVILELRENRAVLLLAGGEVLDAPAETGWQVGDVVPVRPRKAGGRRAVALVLAACLVLAAVGGLWGYNSYYDETSLISVDVNPSFELGLNRWGQVVSVTAYNDDGRQILARVPVVGKAYGEAMQELMASDAMQPYLQAGAYVAFSAYSVDREEELLAYLEELSAQISGAYAVQVSCHAVDEETVHTAHSHHTTGGRLVALQELQALDPDVSIDDYTDVGLGEIQQEIDAHHAGSHHGGTAEEEDGASSQSVAGDDGGHGGGGHGNPGGGHHG